MDLSGYSESELQAILDDIPRELACREKIVHDRFRLELEQLAAKQGRSLGRMLDEAEGHVKRIPKRD